MNGTDPGQKSPVLTESGGNGTMRRETPVASEVEFPAELKDPWVKSRGHLTEIARAKPVADLVDLGVVPDVKALSAKLEPPGPIRAEGEALEEREVPVVSAWAAQRVEASIAPVTDRRSCERCCIEPLADLAGIRNAADLVRAIGGIRQTITALAASQLRVNRQSGRHRHDPGYLPSSKGRSQEAVWTLLQERNIVNEVNGPIVGSVVSAWSAVVLPSEIRIGEIGKIGASAPAGRRIDRARQRVICAHREGPNL